MSNLRNPPLDLTEAALTLLAKTYRDFRVSYTIAIARDGGRIRSTNGALGTHDSRSTTSNGAYFRLICIDEAYSDALHAQLLGSRLPTSTDDLRRLVNDHELQASSTWRSRETAFDNYHRLKLNKFSRWDALKAGIEVRNSVAHGLGALTKRQLGDIKKHRARLQKVDVLLVGTRLQVSAQAVRTCLEYSREYVNWLDRTARQL